jgi:hypothetical protein
MHRLLIRQLTTHQRSVLPSAQSPPRQLLLPKSAVVVAAEVEIAIAQVPVEHELKQ